MGRLAKLVGLALLAACGAPADARRREVVSAITAADAPLIRNRPELVAGKYQKMASDLVDYYRGVLPVYGHDWREGRSELSRSKFALDGPLVLSSSDPHPENFGTLRAADGTWALEPNDFDSADRLPYLWDVRRLCSGMVLVARQSNPDVPGARLAASDDAQQIARAAVEGYRDAILSMAAGGPRVRVVAGSDGDLITADLLQRSLKGWNGQSELTDETTLDANGVRHVIRGVPDPTTPTSAYADLPPEALATLPAALAQYASSLEVPVDPAELTLLDAAQEFGSGVASWPRVRVLALVRGPSDDPSDDFMLELKEMSDSGVGGWLPPGVVADTNPQRVLQSIHAGWGVPDADPRWGATSWLGFDMQVKTHSGGFKTFKVEKAIGALGTPASLERFARTLGGLVARVHASTPETPDMAKRIAAVIGTDPEGFADEQAALAVSYEVQVEADWAGFSQSLQELGPTLGLTPDASEHAPPELTQMFAPPSFGAAP
ncbi:MAG: DUF2252 family protein [Deltaproteobacteria bacterium]|nr:DUF2252 family protein [Deltaproteobacteria bacterium]